MLLHHTHAFAYPYPCFLHTHEVSEPHITPFERSIRSKDKNVLRRSTLAVVALSLLVIVIAISFLVLLLLPESLWSLLEM